LFGKVKSAYEPIKYETIKYVRIFYEKYIIYYEKDMLTEV